MSRSSRDRYEVVIVPSHFGAPVGGTHLGPDAIARQLHLDSQALIRHIHHVEVPDQTIEDRPGGRNVEAVRDVCDRLATCVTGIRRAGRIPIVLHGDDSSVIGTGFGLLRTEKSLAVAYFDAHGDANTPETSPSKCLSGMGLAHLLGHGVSDLLAIGQGKSVSSTNVRLIGARALDPGEKSFLRRAGVAVVRPRDFGVGVGTVGTRLVQGLREAGIRSMYIHIDQDVVDPRESGACLTPEPGGLTVDQLLRTITALSEAFPLAAVSLGNYLPMKDASKRTLRIVDETLVRLGVKAAT